MSIESGGQAEEGARTALRVVAVDRLEDLDAHAAAWDRLAASLPQNLPMLTHAWVRTVLEQVVAPKHPWITLLAYEESGDELAGVLTAALVPAGVPGLRRVFAKVPLYYHTEHGDLVLAPDRASATLPALLAALRERVPGLVGLELGGVREDSPTLAALARRPKGFAVVRELQLHGSSFVLEGDATTWFKGLSKNLRSDLKRSANKAQRDGHGEPELTFLAGTDAPPEVLEELGAIEASGWKGAKGSAIATDPARDARYHALARRFSAAGLLEWHLLRLDGRLAAAHMAVRLGEDLMLLRQGMEQELARYAPGNHLIRAMVEREYARGGREVSLVTDYPWCRRWRMELKPYHRVVIVPARPLPWLASVLPTGTRNVLRRTPGVKRLVRWARSRLAGGGGGAANR